MPGYHPRTVTVAGNAAIAATANAGNVVVLRSPIAGTVTAVRVIPAVAQSASDTNYHDMTLINKGAAGSGTAAVATGHTKATGGTAFTAFDERALTVTATAADKLLAAGDVLALVDTVGGTVTANVLRVEVDIALTAAS
jgi:hypothetical protein